jgi:hypothetical protein
MARRRVFGSSFRRRRNGIAGDGAGGFYPGFYVRVRKAGKSLVKPGGDRTTARTFVAKLD